MDRLVVYRWLCGVVGGLWILAGLGLLLSYFQAMAPGGAADQVMPMGPSAIYFAAFTGCALVGWGGGLIGAARRPDAGRTVGTITSFALVLMAVYRIAGWLMGDYAFLGNLLRIEAAIFLLLALAFVWLRPPAQVAAV